MHLFPCWVLSKGMPPHPVKCPHNVMLLYRHAMDVKPRSGGLSADEKRIFMDMVTALALIFTASSLVLMLQTALSSASALVYAVSTILWPWCQL